MTKQTKKQIEGKLKNNIADFMSKFGVESVDFGSHKLDVKSNTTIKQILTQLENKTIVIKLDNEGAFSGELDIELDDFYITFDLDLQAYFSKPEPTTLEHYYPGGDLEGADIEIADVTVYDSNGDEIELSKEDIDSISKMIENNLEF